MKRELLHLAHDEDGVATVEYAMLLALVVVGTIAAWRTLGATIGRVLEQSAAQVSAGGN